mmetsp:Transcript_167105/g.536687  ORF Transcript_167105/g.536687 Transcript_167105/m.536687 type:complete len:266 (+) Transcript_167105:465-1262(+)
MPGIASMLPRYSENGAVCINSSIFRRASTAASRSLGSRSQPGSTKGGTRGSADCRVTDPRESGWLYSVAKYMVDASNSRTGCTPDKNRPSLTKAFSVHGSAPLFSRPPNLLSHCDTNAFTITPASMRDTKITSISQPLSEPLFASRPLSTSDFQNAMPLSPVVPAGPPPSANSTFMPSGACQGMASTGWSCRCRPTAGMSATTGIPSLPKACASPTPLSSSNCGDCSAPAESTTSRAAGTATREPSLSCTSTPVHRVPSKSNLRV